MFPYYGTNRFANGSGRSPNYNQWRPKMQQMIPNLGFSPINPNPVSPIHPIINYIPPIAISPLMMHPIAVSPAITLATATPVTTTAPKRGRQENGKVSRKFSKWSNAKWRQNLHDYYILMTSNSTQMSISKYMRDVVQEESARTNFNRTWNRLGFNEFAKSKVRFDDKRIQDALDKQFPVDELTKARSCTRLSNSIFTEHEERLATELLVQLSEAGHPMSRPNFVDLLRKILKKDTGADLTISATTAKRIYQNAGIKSNTNTSSLDPSRALQANPKVLDAFFKDLDTMVHLLHRTAPTVWPDRFANLPPSRNYNTDEQGPNPTKLAHAVLVPDDMRDICKKAWRSTREGDGRMKMHYTVVNTVVASGARCVPALGLEGAPPPYIIISDPLAVHKLDNVSALERDLALHEQSVDDVIEISDVILQGWFNDYDPNKPVDFTNPYGFQIRTTPSGSMLRRTFFHYICHFINHLPHDQGPGGKGVVLTCDWHSSRACPKSMMHAFQNNVYIHILPSKTSIWSQACDNGENEAVEVSIAQVAESNGLLATQALTYEDANIVFREGLEQHADKQLAELRRNNRNAAKTSFKKIGLHPFSYSNESWGEAMNTLGKLVKLIEDAKANDGADIAKMIWIAALKTEEEIEELSDNEKKKMQEHTLPTKWWRFQNLHHYLQARLIGENMIDRYVKNTQRNKMMPPQPQTEVETIACKLIKFVPASERVNTVSTLSAAEVLNDESRTYLAITEIGKSVLLTKKSDHTQTFHATKQSAKTFIMIDPQQRNNQPILLMTTDIPSEYVVTCHEQQLLTEDRRRNRKRALANRKKLVADMQQTAEEVAKNNRQLHLIQCFRTLLEQYKQGQMSSERLFEKMQTMFEGEYSEQLAITQDELTKTFHVKLFGFNTCAVSASVRDVIIEALTKIERTKRESRRRTTRRQPIQTKTGKSGLSTAVCLSRHRVEEDLEKRLKVEVKEAKELEEAQDLLESIKADIAANENSYWVVGRKTMPGKRRVRMAKLCEAYKSSDSAQQQTEKLTALELTKEKVDSKVVELEAFIREKNTTVGTLITARRVDEKLLADSCRLAITFNNRKSTYHLTKPSPMSFQCRIVTVRHCQ